ncbi:hypothetical protein J6590_064185 [Homalodisca vitripennis]|nr:hypothetical protein J6590_064185 [Homalodisca vitripennis]
MVLHWKGIRQGEDFTIVSYYFTHNESILDFQTKIDSLEDTLRTFYGNVVVDNVVIVTFGVGFDLC